MKPATAVKWVIAGLAVAALAGFLVYAAGEYRARSAYNHAIENLYNEGRFEEAAASFEAMLPGAPDHLEPQVRRHLAECYLNLGDSPELSTAESAAWFRKARDVDPEVLEARHRRVMEAEGG